MACGLVRVARAELDSWVADPTRRIHPLVFDASDGVRLHSRPFSGYAPHVAKSIDGKLWFTAGDGVSVVDPRHLPFKNSRRRCTSSRSSLTDNVAARTRACPALTRNLRDRLYGSQLVAPEKNRFKYGSKATIATGRTPATDARLSITIFRRASTASA